MTRLVSLTVLVVVLAASRLASAQSTGDDSGSGTLPNGATIQLTKLETYDLGDKEFGQTNANSDDRRRAFNRASCNCARKHTVAYTGGAIPAESDARSVGWFRYLMTETAASGLHVGVDFWVGSSCGTDSTRTTNCKKLSYSLVSDIDALLYTKKDLYQSFNLYDIVNGKLHDEDTAAADPDPNDVNSARCQALDTNNAAVYIFANTTGGTDTYDYQDSQVIGTQDSDGSTTATGADTNPPPAPTNLKAEPSDSSINLTWTQPSSRNTDIAYYQALCADMTNSVARPRVSGARYVTTASLCSDADPNDIAEEALTSVASSADNEQPADAPGGAFGNLEASYICGEAATGTAKSMKITGLKNGIPYRLILLSVDLYGNYTGLYFDHTVTPIPVTDFWEDLHDGDNGPQGGLCLLAETYGDDSSLTSALRGFRDDDLGGSGAGRWLARAYYATLGQAGGLVHGSLALRVLSGIVLAPLVAVALAWHWLTLPGLLAALVLLGLGWRWRARLALRGRRWAVLGGLVVISLAPELARADKFQPYWENDPLDKSKDAEGAPSDPNFDPTFDPTLETHNNNGSSNPFTDDKDKFQDVSVGPSPTRFHVGIKTGPYFPDIDKQAGKPSYGPYRQMFGGYDLMPMLDVEYVLWNTDYGQLTVGGTIGYLQKSADGFVDGSTPGDHHRPRVPGADNKFQLVPTALTAGYRFTYLDEAYGVPLVPYVRGGLSYYIWRVTAPNGDTAELCSGTGTAQMCSNKALGASVGVQGAIGLAVRLERIDAGTAKSLRDSGIQHLGIYGELSIAKVDGFGSDDKLSVGDRTWFAGVDFEF